MVYQLGKDVPRDQVAPVRPRRRGATSIVGEREQPTINAMTMNQRMTETSMKTIAMIV